MNTYFFLRVRLGRDLGRRSFVYGPYIQYEDATRVLDYIADILEGLGIETTSYVATIEEKHLIDEAWVKVKTCFRLRVQGDLVTTESE